MSNYGTPGDPNQPSDPYGQQGGQPQYDQNQNYGGAPQYDQNQGYGAAPQYDPAAAGQYGGGYGGAPVENKKATPALVLSILGLCCFVFSIAGIVMGVMAQKEIQASNGQQTGEGKAKAAIWVGVVMLVLGVISNIVYYSMRK